MLAVGCDIGGHHISATVVDIIRRELTSYPVVYRDVDRKAGADQLLAAWKSAIEQACAPLEPGQCVGVGIAMPGPFDYRSGIALFEGTDKFEALQGMDVGRELSEALGSALPLRFVNDASAFAIGAATGQLARGHTVAITLGTGFGSCFLDDGVPLVDASHPGIPPCGSLWHLPYRDGIADDYISSRWFVKAAQDRYGFAADGVAPIAKAARAGDPVAALFGEFGANLAEIVAPWLTRFECDQIVMGGRISGAFDLFGPALKAGLAECGLDCRIDIHETTEDAAMIGGAMTIHPEFWQRLEPVLPSR